LTGNMARTLMRLGYDREPRVSRAVDWLLSVQLEDGGWNCWDGGTHGSFEATVQPLGALSEIPQEHRSDEVEEAISHAVDFFLSHRLFKSSRDESVVLFRFLKFHFPLHYKYDVLHGLRVITSLGVKDDRLHDPIQLLVSKQQPDGAWILDAVPRGWRLFSPSHGGWRQEEDEVIEKGWGEEPHTLQFEEVGTPSKMITLNALRVLKNLDTLKLPTEYLA
ncbi:MAG: prenyltransferase/squalene oxidase repeat-containing protein, partial [Candidatus Geothermarchaeales archaeon]